MWAGKWLLYFSGLCAPASSVCYFCFKMMKLQFPKLFLHDLAQPFPGGDVLQRRDESICVSGWCSIAAMPFFFSSSLFLPENTKGVRDSSSEQNKEQRVSDIWLLPIGPGTALCPLSSVILLRHSQSLTPLSLMVSAKTLPEDAPPPPCRCISAVINVKLFFLYQDKFTR